VPSPDYRVGGWVMMSHPNWSRRTTVWRATWGASVVVEKAYALGQHSSSPVLNRPSEFFWMSHNTCQRLLWSHAPWSRPTIHPFDPKTQLAWLCRQTVLFWIFAAWAKRNAATHVIVIWSHVWSGTPRFRHPWQSNPKSCHFRLRSA